MSKQKFLRVLGSRSNQSKAKKGNMLKKATAFIVALGLGLGIYGTQDTQAKEIELKQAPTTEVEADKVLPPFGVGEPEEGDADKDQLDDPSLDGEKQPDSMVNPDDETTPGIEDEKDFDNIFGVDNEVVDPGFDPNFGIDQDFSQEELPEVDPGFSQEELPEVDPDFSQDDYPDVDPGFSQDDYPEVDPGFTVEPEIDPGFNQDPDKDKVDEDFTVKPEGEYDVDPDFSVDPDRDPVDPGFTQDPDKDKIDEDFSVNPDRPVPPTEGEDTTTPPTEGEEEGEGELVPTPPSEGEEGSEDTTTPPTEGEEGSDEEGTTPPTEGEDDVTPPTEGEDTTTPPTEGEEGSDEEVEVPTPPVDEDVEVTIPTTPAPTPSTPVDTVVSDEVKQEISNAVDEVIHNIVTPLVSKDLIDSLGVSGQVLTEQQSVEVAVKVIANLKVASAEDKAVAVSTIAELAKSDVKLGAKYLAEIAVQVGGQELLVSVIDSLVEDIASADVSVVSQLLAIAYGGDVDKITEVLTSKGLSEEAIAEIVAQLKA